MKALIVVDIPDNTLSGWNVEQLSINKHNINERSVSFGAIVDSVDYYAYEIQLTPFPQKDKYNDNDFVVLKTKDEIDSILLGEDVNRIRNEVIEEILGE